MDKKTHNAELKKILLDACEDLQQNLTTLKSHSASMSRLNGEAARMVKEFSERSASSLESISTHAGSQAEILGTVKEMQEMQMSFNLQYLMLQNQMQNENRQFTLVSNIMKTKHDTVKNSISNIR